MLTLVGFLAILTYVYATAVRYPYPHHKHSMSVTRITRPLDSHVTNLTSLGTGSTMRGAPGSGKWTVSWKTFSVAGIAGGFDVIRSVLVRNQGSITLQADVVPGASPGKAPAGFL